MDATRHSSGRTGRVRQPRVRWAAAAAALLMAVAAVLVGAAAPTVRAGATSHGYIPPTGYWLMAGDGGVFTYGDTGFHGSMGGTHLNAPIVGAARTSSSNGYWEVASDGGVFAFGDAPFFGSMGGQHLNAPIVAMAATPDGQGYWLFASDGGVFAFGDATFHGSLGGTVLNAPIVGATTTGTGNGYWLVGSDGGVFTYGDATFHGSLGGNLLTAPVVGLAGTQLGNGYWLAAANGGVFSYGDATFYGSAGGQRLASPIVGIASTADAGGYTLAGADGGVFTYGDAPFDGSAGGLHLNAPVVAMAQVGPTVGGRVLTVGTFHGVPGQFSTIQAAVDAARPGDWVLVAPGDYHEDNDITNPPSAGRASVGWFGGVEIDTPYVHLRGMDRSSVIVDGTKAGSSTCSNAPADQNPGAVIPGYNSNSPIGRNGILVWKANGVSVDNLTVCNFITGSSGGGNEVWWDGEPSEATSGPLGVTGYSGSYLTATSSYYDSTTNTGGAYGIFSSASSLGVWNNIYASNFNDSGMYIGACRNLCDAWINNAWMEYNPLGYSGTNSGGTLVVSNSQFDNNQDGFDTNTQIASDPPPVQDGTCPDGGVSGITHTTSCWVFMNNNDHDNNNPNVPGGGAGYAGAGPVGTGITISGAHNDTLLNNTFSDNGAWGALFLPFPDSDTPPAGISCSGQGQTEVPAGFLSPSSPAVCIYDAFGDAMVDNTFSHNGFFGNPTNSDFGNLTVSTGIPQNCFRGNVMPDGSEPADLQTTNAVCGPLTTASNFSLTPGTLAGEILCNSGLLGTGFCLPTDNYPRQTSTTPQALPSNLPTMPNPCAGVPGNAWCPGGKPA